MTVSPGEEKAGAIFSESDNVVSDDDLKSTKQTGLTEKIASAMENVIHKKTTLNENSGDSDGQTANSGDSPQSHEQPDTLNSDSGNGQAASSDSTPVNYDPPESWPTDRKDEYSTLPDNAKSLVLSFYKDMEQGLKKQFNKLDTVKKEFETNYGLDADSLKTLSEQAQQFKENPETVINQLAEQAGINIYFADPNPDDIPDFDSQADLVRYLKDQATSEARQAAVNLNKQQQAEQQKADMQHQVEQEFSKAYQKYPDLPDHKEAVIDFMSGYNLPVEVAYRLATWEGLEKLAQEGQSQRSKLDKAHAELEKLQKLATIPPGRSDGQAGTKPNGKTSYERCWDKAFQKRLP
ncbi:hypothetical protein CI610_01378 [invertebrate metagenome]|uniref:Uncharacterized protein n=1 Tax=invertebrate metagenome TaxID=1711999 RepID=A0A2H9T8X7_9ZZZZ